MITEQVPYPWTFYDDELDEDAIIVGIGGTSALMIAHGLSYVEPCADIYWFARVTHRGFFEAGAEHGFTVPAALIRAEVHREQMGYSRVVITIQQEGLWRPAWGRLAEIEGLS